MITIIGQINKPFTVLNNIKLTFLYMLVPIIVLFNIEKEGVVNQILSTPGLNGGIDCPEELIWNSVGVVHSILTCTYPMCLTY